jgi:hypothetical protein
MPQTTLDRVTDRVRELADRTGEATNQALSSVLPDRRTARRSVRRWQGRITRRLRLNARPRAGKAAPMEARMPWPTGEIAGRLEGIAATIPNMTRLWLGRSMAQVRGRAATGGAKAAARRMPVGIAGWRLIGRPRDRGMSPANVGRARNTVGDQLRDFTKRVAGAAAVTGGIAALNKRLSRASAQASTSMRQRAKAAPRVRVAPRGWMLRRRTRATGPWQGTQRQLRRSWRWVRLFTIGFALGAIWAYLFAPRRPSAEEQQAATQQGGTAEQQRSAARS